MTDIKRYKIHPFFGRPHETNAYPDKNGYWIKASDHDAAMAEKDKRIAELEVMLKRNAADADYLYDLAIDSGVCSEWLKVKVTSNPDGCLNKIKADAVREAAEYVRQLGIGGAGVLKTFAIKLERGEV